MGRGWHDCTEEINGEITVIILMMMIIMMQIKRSQRDL